MGVLVYGFEVGRVIWWFHYVGFRLGFLGRLRLRYRLLWFWVFRWVFPRVLPMGLSVGLGLRHRLLWFGC